MKPNWSKLSSLYKTKRHFSSFQFLVLYVRRSQGSFLLECIFLIKSIYHKIVIWIIDTV